MIIVMTSLGLTSKELSQQEGTTRTMTFQAATNPTVSTFAPAFTSTASENGVYVDLGAGDKLRSKDSVE